VGPVHGTVRVPGPLEIDLASQRFIENPVLLLSQMRTFASLSGDADPVAAFDRQKKSGRRRQSTSGPTSERNIP
jgi:hypothetical protein